MSESIQTQGKTVDEAIAEACLQLGLRRDEVDVRVTQEPKSGLLGFIGGRPAKVVVRKKPERHRGGGRSHRSDDGGAHSLGRGRGGRSRGGRGRGGRGHDGQQGDQPNNDNVVAQEAERDSERSSGGGRGRGRGSRGRGRGRNNEGQESRYDGRGRSRQEAGSEAASGGGASRQDSSRQDKSRQEGNRQDSTQQDSSPQDSSRQDSSRRDDPRRSRRGTRGGRGRSRRNNPENNPVSNEAPSEVAPAAIVNEVSAVRQDEQAPPAVTVERTAERAVEAQNVAETPVAAAPTPEQPKTEPAEAPAFKKKRGGRGGGLGSRLKSKSNPSVKTKPAAAEIASPSPELTAPVPVPTPLPPQERAPRYEERDRRPSDEIDEVIISGVKATKYADAVTGVTEENLEATLSDMTSGVLVRAGFSCEVEVADGEYREVRITSDDESAGLLIGRHGQTVDAIEHLIERMVSNSIDDRVRMNLDINEYRQRRQEDLVARVADAVRDVRDSGRAYHMESMSARERRLVHLEAENIEGIRTFTMSGNGGKHVVIAEDDESDNDDRHDD